MNNINMLYAIWIVRKFTLFIVIIFEIYILIGKLHIQYYSVEKIMEDLEDPRAKIGILLKLW